MVARLAAAAIPFSALPLGLISKKLQWKAGVMTIHQLLKLPTLWFKFARLRSMLRPDLTIHCTAHHLVLLFPFLDRRRTVFHVHDALPKTRTNRFLLALIRRRIACFVAVSDFARQRLIELGVPSHQVVRIYNATDLAGQVRPNALAAREFFSAPRIGIVGQVRAPKGHDDMLEAARILREKGIAFRLLVFGAAQPDYLQELQRRAAVYGLDDAIEWRGYERDRDHIYSNLDISVVPSRVEETFGLAALEPAMWSLPVVCTDIGGLREIVEDGVTGFVVEPRRADELAFRLEALISDPELRRQLGQNAREQALRRFSPMKMASDFEELFRVLTRDEVGPRAIRRRSA